MIPALTDSANNISDIFETRPSELEYASFYRGYVDHVPEGNVIDFLIRQMASTAHLFGQIAESDAAMRYANGKWSIKEVAGHLCDTERIFGGRALRFARNDTSELPGMDQDPYVAAARFDERTLADLSDELYFLRRANVALFRSFSVDDLNCGGVASGWPVTVRALVYIIGGHQEHHVRVLESRYLPLITRRAIS